MSAERELEREDRVARAILDSAICVHKALGPGLLESAYEECLSYELRSRGLAAQRQVSCPITYREVRLEAGFRMDVVVDGVVLIELNSVERLLPVHEAQVLTYLRLSGLRLGMLLNFNVRLYARRGETLCALTSLASFVCFVSFVSNKELSPSPLASQNGR